MEAFKHSDDTAMVQEEIDGYLRPMQAQDWDKGSLLSMRTMNFASSFPYESITVPVDIIIGEDDTFLLKTARRVCSLALHFLQSYTLLQISSMRCWSPGLHQSCLHESAAKRRVSISMRVSIYLSRGLTHPHDERYSCAGC
jgi:hypothetical protein